MIRDFIGKLKEQICSNLKIIIFVIIVIIGLGSFDLFSILNNEMSLFELISLNLTLGSLLVIYFTLFELKKQREAIYKPDIVLKSSGRFFIYNEKDCYFANSPSLWVDEETTKAKIFSKNNSLEEYERLKMPDQEIFKELSKNPNRNEIGIPLFNIGKGAAKNIDIKWKFDLDEYFEEKKTKNLKKFDFTGTFVASKNISEDSYFSRKIDYITPSITGSLDENIEKVYIPYDFQLLFNKYIILEKKEDSNISSNILKLNISYDDLANQRHFKKFIFNFQEGYGSWNSNLNELKTTVIYHMEMKYQISEIN